MVVEFKVKATGECLQFQWKKDCKNLHDDSKYRGTKTDTLHIKEVEKSDKGCYQCLVKNHVREKFSEEAALTVSKLVRNVIVFLLCFMYIILVNEFDVDVHFQNSVLLMTSPITAGHI